MNLLVQCCYDFKALTFKSYFVDTNYRIVGKTYQYRIIRKIDALFVSAISPGRDDVLLV